MHSKISIPDSLDRLKENWSLKIVGVMDGSHEFKIARIKGSYVWHTHPNTDEVFYILGGGPLTIKFHEKDGGDVVLHKGDLLVIPKAVEHCPIAEEETEIMIIEKVGAVNTANGDSTPVFEDFRSGST